MDSFIFVPVTTDTPCDCGSYDCPACGDGISLYDLPEIDAAAAERNRITNMEMEIAQLRCEVLSWCSCIANYDDNGETFAVNAAQRLEPVLLRLNDLTKCLPASSEYTRR